MTFNLVNNYGNVDITYVLCSENVPNFRECTKMDKIWNLKKKCCHVVGRKLTHCWLPSSLITNLTCHFLNNSFWLSKNEDYVENMIHTQASYVMTVFWRKGWLLAYTFEHLKFMWRLETGTFSGRSALQISRNGKNKVMAIKY